MARRSGSNGAKVTVRCRINRRADVNRTLGSVFADQANTTVAGSEISLSKKKFHGSIERQSFVCVKKGFDVDIGAYITHVIDDSDSSRWLQPVVSCAD